MDTNTNIDLGNLGKPANTEKDEYGGNGLFEHTELNEKELKCLKKNNYSQIKHKFDNVYTIQNKKTKKIVELRGLSAIHACNLIGWRFRQVVILSEYKISKNKNMHMLKELKKIRSNEYGTVRDLGLYGHAKKKSK